MHHFYIFNLKKGICWCTVYEDINKIVLHNSFINVLFNQTTRKKGRLRKRSRVILFILNSCSKG